MLIRHNNEIHITIWNYVLKKMDKINGFVKKYNIGVMYVIKHVETISFIRI